MKEALNLYKNFTQNLKLEKDLKKAVPVEVLLIPLSQVNTLNRIEV